MTGMRVLVTGVDGYIGAVLGPRLLEHGFDVVGIDCGVSRDVWLYNDDYSRPPTYRKTCDRSLRPTSKDSRRLCISPNCRTTLSVNSTSARPMRSIISVQ